MIGAAGADPGRSDVHSHIHWIWEDSRHARMKDKCCAVGYMERRNTGRRRKARGHATKGGGDKKWDSAGQED